MTKSHNTTLKNKIVQYDNFGDTFGKSRQNMHWDEIDTILSDFLHNPVREGRIADIGCGNGRLLKHIQKYPDAESFQKNFSAYIGLDTSSVLLSQARSDDALSDFFTLTDWIQGDMRDIVEKIQKYGLFDGLFFIASFHHLSSRDERVSVLKQAKKLLSKTGKIIMINWNLSHPSQIKYQTSKMADYPDGSSDFDIKIGDHKRFYHAFSHEEYASLAAEIGLSVSDTFGERNSIAIWS
ncbi:class I SAM-dependent methyltransferase [Candidatus Gracilibacteria bacterium]|nr:class I SAM-dependent methyltransferase [Candidatus Gracilibacteria bacterium]